MTRLNLLEDQKAILTAQKEVLENKRGDIYVREQKAISDALLPFFSNGIEIFQNEVKSFKSYDEAYLYATTVLDNGFFEIIENILE